MYKTLTNHYKETFGTKVYKLSVDGGFTCPNRDGTLDTRGCIFCSALGGGDFAEKSSGNVIEQLERAKERVKNKIKDGKYIAYFQAFTNTYAPISHLEKLYKEAISPDYIVAIAIGTRPDCLGNDVIELLSEINEIKPVYVELGFQTMHQNSVNYIRRGYSNEVYADSVRKLKDAGINVVTHIIIGLPDETKEMMKETTKYAINAGTDGVKFHLLHVLQGTDLAVDYEKGRFSCLSMEEYGEILKDCLSVVPDDVVVHRITGDGAKKDLIAPLWSADKKRVLNYLKRVLE